MTERDEPDEMSPEDAARWHGARTLGDLGELAALWLEGEIASMPGTFGRPDSETTPLVPVLAAVNRSGFYTWQSQPGVLRNKNGCPQRADISGFASGETFARLMAAVAGADLVVAAARGLEEDWGMLLVITPGAPGEEDTKDGGSQSREALEASYIPPCHPDAVRALRDAWQITLIDPVWGRNDQLWPLLEKFAGRGRG